MKNLNNPFSQVGLGALDQAVRATQLALKSSEQLFNLNMQYVKQALEQNAESGQKILKCNDLQIAAQEAGQLSTKKTEHLTKHLQDVYEWATRLQQNTQKLSEESVTKFQESCKCQLEELKASSPEATHALFDHVQTTLDNAKQTLGSLQTAATHVQKTVEENLRKVSATAQSKPTAAKTNRTTSV